MRLFIISDSHGDLFTLDRILSRATGFDAILHLGDGAADMLLEKERTENIPVICVRGNCDSPAYGYPDKEVLTFDDVRILACHGHAYGVKYGMTRLSLAAEEAGAALCLFGHTHSPLCEQADGITFLNPGSVKNGCYAIAELKKGRCYPVLLSL